MKTICLDEQHFPQIREKNGVYVDKTRIIYDLLKDGKYFFISRPRRFGKSLLCSTLAALFAGKKDLFEGLWIHGSDWSWQKHPVIHLDMTGAASPAGNAATVQECLIHMLRRVARLYEISGITTEIADLYFSELIQRLYEKTGQRAVVIIDEYDKPLLDVIHHKEKYPAIHDILRGFYAQLKNNSESLRFVLLTGVFKFAKTSVFSGLNNIKDLTFEPKAAELFGYTEQEMQEYFPEHLDALCKKLSQTREELLEVLREKYNGYSFGIDTDVNGTIGSVYNPFALNYVFSSQQLLDRWFISATPTLLIQKLKEQSFAGIDPSELVAPLRTLEDSCSPDDLLSLSLLYYAGYVTLRAYDSRRKVVTLDFPNAEVAQAFSVSLLPAISNRSQTSFGVITRHINDLLYNKDVNGLKDTLNQGLAMMPYFMFGTQESYYQTVIYLLFNASSVVTVAEDMTNRGRADITILLPDVIYIFELKMNQPAARALEQIKQRGYAQKYMHLRRKIFVVGVELCNSERVIKDLVFEELV